MSQLAKNSFILLVVANLLLLAVIFRTSWPRFANSKDVDPEDCGTCDEAIQVGQEAARDYLDAQRESVVIHEDVTATLFKQTRTWIVKGFAGSTENVKSFRWIVILAYHPRGGWTSRWEIVSTGATPLEMESRSRSGKSKLPEYDD
jgi:hypothetical protein